MSENRYRLTIGMSVVKEDAPAYSDNGIVYSNLRYEQVTELESLFAKHSADMMSGMQGLIDDLLKLGATEAQNRQSSGKPDSAQAR